MNKYKIFISFIIMFVLVIIPINYTYCVDKYGFKEDESETPLITPNQNKNSKDQNQKSNKESQEQTKKEYDEYGFYEDDPLEVEKIKKEAEEKAKKEAEEKAKKEAEEKVKRAAEEKAKAKEEASKYSITSQSFMNNWNPVNSNQGAFVEEGTKTITNLIVFIVNKVLGLIQIFSGILMVLCITYTGFNMILSIKSDVAHDIGLNFVSMGGEKSPTLKKRVLDNIRRLLIGSILTFSSTTLVKIAFSLFTSF